MTARVARYNPAGTSRTQTMANGGGSTTSVSVNVRGRLNDGPSVLGGTFTTNQTLTSGGLYSYRLNGVFLFDLFYGAGTPPGTYNMLVSLSGQEVFPNDTFSIVAPSNAIAPFGTSLTFNWRILPLQYVVVPETQGAIRVPLGGSWVEPREWWVAEQVGPNSFEWVRAWNVPPPPPDGATISNITQEFLFGGGVNVSWTNLPNTTGMGYDLQPQINGFNDTIISGATTGSNNEQTVLIPANRFSNGNTVRARMRYTSGGVAGEWGPFSPIIIYSG